MIKGGCERGERVLTISYIDLDLVIFAHVAHGWAKRTFNICCVDTAGLLRASKALPGYDISFIGET